MALIYDQSIVYRPPPLRPPSLFCVASNHELSPSPGAGTAVVMVIAAAEPPVAGPGGAGVTPIENIAGGAVVVAPGWVAGAATIPPDAVEAEAAPPNIVVRVEADPGGAGVTPLVNIAGGAVLGAPGWLKGAPG